MPAVAAPDKILLEETFEAAAVGGKPAGWIPFVDEGNEMAIVEAPAIGKRCLRITREGGTVWKPMISGNVHGEPESPLCFEFDFRVPALAGSGSGVLTAILRGDGNVAVVTIALGGPGGAAVPQDGGGWLSLGFPLRPGEWVHVKAVVDPIARKERGAFDLTLTQGKERMTVPNIPFRPTAGKPVPAAWWHSPTFQVAGGATGKPHAAYVDNVRLTTCEGREYE